MIKKFRTFQSITILILFLIVFITSGFSKPEVYKIDAEKNAVIHNNLGLKAVSEGNYSGAIQEFSLAIALNPKTQATAVYYNNLGEVYMKLGYFKEAQRCFENSINQYNLNFLYYQNLVKSFKAQKIMPAKINFYKLNENKDPLYMVILGLLYAESGDIRSSVIKLDEFCMKEPNLLITNAVRNYIKKLIPED